MKKIITSSIVAISFATSASAAVWSLDTVTQTTGVRTGTLDGVGFTFTSSDAGSFNLGSSVPELARFTEDISATFTLTANAGGFNNITLLAHNLIFDNNGPQGNANGDSPNTLSNFTITYVDGTVITNAFDTIGSIVELDDASGEFAISPGTNGPFPTGIASAFENSQILTDNGDGSLSASTLAGPGVAQSAGLISFNQAQAISEISYTYVSGSDGGNTAFFGFSGTAVPEPSSAMLLGLGAFAFISRRKR